MKFKLSYSQAVCTMTLNRPHRVWILEGRCCHLPASFFFFLRFCNLIIRTLLRISTHLLGFLILVIVPFHTFKGGTFHQPFLMESSLEICVFFSRCITKFSSLKSCRVDRSGLSLALTVNYQM